MHKQNPPWAEGHGLLKCLSNNMAKLMFQIAVQIKSSSGNRGKEYVFSLTGSSQTVQCIIILRVWAGVYVKRQQRDNAIPSWPVVEVLAPAHMPGSKNNPRLQCKSPVICHNTLEWQELTLTCTHMPTFPAFSIIRLLILVSTAWR